MFLDMPGFLDERGTCPRSPRPVRLSLLGRHRHREIGALLAEARACYDDAEHADPATVAIGHCLITAFELRLCIDVENEMNSGWDYDLEGPPLNGIDEEDCDDVSRPVAERAAEAARAALDADPEDPLVPIQLGHALAWLGDRDGAVAAYREALRRDPSDEQADTCLELLEVESSPPPTPEASPRSYAFAVLRAKFRISNSEWGDMGHVFGTFVAAREAAEKMLGETGDLTREDLDSFMKLELDVHRPGQPVATFELMRRIPAEPNEGPFQFDWSDVPLDESLEPPLPPGRPVRIENSLCF